MKSPDFFNYEYLRNYVLSIVPHPPVQYVVSAAQQQKEIDSLKATLGSRRFFFVNNLEHFETEQVHGTAQWLGYREKEFTLKWYLDHVLHPGKKKSVVLVARQLYESVCTGRYQLDFMVQRYSSLVALRHYKGHYVLANKISSVFQYDVKNRLTSYLNEFTIIGDYTGQPLGPDFFNDNGTPEPRGMEVMQRTLQLFLSLKVFSPQQFQMARRMAYEPKITKAQVAEELGIKENTVIEFGKRFKEKAEEFFHQPFDSVSDVAVFLKKEGLL